MLKRLSFFLVFLTRGYILLLRDNKSISRWHNILNNVQNKNLVLHGKQFCVFDVAPDYFCCISNLVPTKITKNCFMSTKKSWCSTKRCFMSAKTRWCCAKKSFVLNNFSRPVPHILTAQKMKFSIKSTLMQMWKSLYMLVFI